METDAYRDEFKRAAFIKFFLKLIYFVTEIFTATFIQVYNG